jgi:hypothetical protein
LHVGRAKFVQNVMRGRNAGIKGLIRRYKNRHTKEADGVKTRYPPKFAAEFMAIGAKSAVFWWAAGTAAAKLHEGLTARFPRAGDSFTAPASDAKRPRNGAGRAGGKSSLSLTNSRTRSVEAPLKKLLAFLRA